MNATYTMNAGYQANAYAGKYARRNEYGNAAAVAKQVAMLVAVPLVGLAGITLGPVVGLAVLVWMGIKALPKRVKDIALFLAGPFVGLGYLMAFPLVGVGMLAWAGVNAARRK